MNISMDLFKDSHHGNRQNEFSHGTRRRKHKRVWRKVNSPLNYPRKEPAREPKASPTRKKMACRGKTAGRKEANYTQFSKGKRKVTLFYREKTPKACKRRISMMTGTMNLIIT